MRIGCFPRPHRPRTANAAARDAASSVWGLVSRPRHGREGQTPWMPSFMAMVQGPYFFLQKPFTCFQKWWSNVNFHGLFIALPYREKEKKWLKCDFTKYFVFKKLSLCGQKGKRKVTVFIVLSRLLNKEGSVLQNQIVQLLPADKKSMNFEANFK